MRTCDAVGVQEIFILNTRIGPHRKWGKKSSSSANKWLTIRQFTDAEACFNAVKESYGTILTTHLEGDAKSLYDLDLTGKVALVFGNEHEGVSEDIRSRADGNFLIPQVGIIRSLNISVACAVSLYEAFRQKQAQGHYAQPKLPEDKMGDLRTQWGFELDQNEITGVE
jgi:tRNA (guanosine-2'-O-)-methyltransferase